MTMLPPAINRRAHRMARFERASLDADARTVELAFSSEEPIERVWGVEILGHDPGEMDDSWIGSGQAPLLMDHDPRDQVGVVESVTIGPDRKARARVRFGRSARAEEVMQDVADGIRANVSVGYELLRVVPVKEEKGKPTVYRATRWRPLEVSLVSVPADMTVGVGRAGDLPPIPDEPKTEEARMSDPIAVQAPEAPKDNPEAAAAAERRRRDEIMALAEIANQRDLGVTLVLEGASVAEARERILAARGAPRPTPASQLGMSEREVRKYSVFRALRAVASNDWSDAGLEYEAHKTLAERFGGQKAPSKRSFYVPLDIQERVPTPTGQRDLIAGTGSAGGFLVATTNMSFIEQLRGRSVTMAMGATRMTGLVGNVTIPRQSAPATAYWLATESTAATESQQTFQQLSLTPKNVAAYTEISRQLMLQSDPSAETLVMNDLAAVVALAVDSAALNGTGASGQPMGILNTSGVGSVTGTSLGYAGIIEFQTDVISANALVNPGAAGYVSTPLVAGLLMARQRFSGTDTPLWDGGVLDGRIAGFRAMSSTQVPTATMIFGDWSQLVIGEWGTLEIEVNPYANFAAAIIGVRAFYTVDVAVRYPASFAVATSIT
jgi:HK97 family phage major capsid protein